MPRRSSERELRVDPRERRPQSGFALFQQACGLQGAYITVHALVISPEFARDGGDRQIRPAAHEADEFDPLRRQRCQQLFQALEREMFLVYRLPALGSSTRLDEAAPGGFQTFHVDANLTLPRHRFLLAASTSARACTTRVRQWADSCLVGRALWLTPARATARWSI